VEKIKPEDMWKLNWATVHIKANASRDPLYYAKVEK